MHFDECITQLKEELDELRGSEDSEKIRTARKIFSKAIQEHGFYMSTLDHILEKQGKLVSVVLHHQANDYSPQNVPMFHMHDYFEMVYMYRGEGISLFKDTEVSLKEGEILLLNPNSIHDFYTRGENSYALNIIIRKKLFESSMEQLLTDNHLLSRFFASYTYQINTSKDYLFFPSAADEEIQQTVLSFLREYTKKESVYQSILHSQIVILLAQISRLYAHESSLGLQYRGNISVIPMIIKYINEHCDTITLDMLHKEFSYSTTYLSKMIKKHTGQTFSELQTNFRLQRSQKLVCYTDTPLSQVAVSVGFKDYIYFGKVFKKKYGMSPSQFRKMNK